MDAGGAAISAAVPVIAVLCALLLYAIIMRPQWGLPIAVFLLWTDTAGVLSFYHGAPTALAVIVPILLIAPLVAGLLQGERFRLDSGFFWIVAVLLAEIISTLFSHYQGEGVSRISKFVQEGLIVYLLLFNVVRTPGGLRSAAWAIVAGGAFLALFTAAQELFHRYDHTFFGYAQLDHAFFQGKDSSPRAQGPLADPNYYAQILLPSLALALVMFLREPGRRVKWCAGIAGVLIVIALVYTYSRGGALAVVAVLFALAGFRYLRVPHLAACAAVIVVVLIAFPSYANRLASLGGLGGATAQVGSSTAADLSIQSRATENLAAWLAFQAHPATGVGPGSFPTVYQHYAALTGGPVHTASRTASQGQAAGEAPQRAAHEIVLGVMAEQGVVGVVAFLGLIGTAILGLMTARSRWRGVDPRLETLATGFLLGLVGYLVSGVFLQLAFERYLWALVALCMAAAQMMLRDRRAFVPESLGE